MSRQGQINKRWLCSKEAADYLGCHPSFLDRDRISGNRGIPFARLGSHIRYDLADLDAFLQSSKTGPGQQKEGDDL